MGEGGSLRQTSGQFSAHSLVETIVHSRIHAKSTPNHAQDDGGESRQQFKYEQHYSTRSLIVGSEQGASIRDLG